MLLNPAVLSADPVVGARAWLQTQGCRCPVDRRICDCTAERCTRAVVANAKQAHRALRPVFRELPLDPAIGEVVDRDCAALADPLDHHPCVVSRLRDLAEELANPNMPVIPVTFLCEEAGENVESCQKTVRSKYRTQVLAALEKLGDNPVLASALEVREGCGLGGQLKIHQLIESLALDRRIAWKGSRIVAPKTYVAQREPEPEPTPERTEEAPVVEVAEAPPVPEPAPVVTEAAPVVAEAAPVVEPAPIEVVTKPVVVAAAPVAVTPPEPATRPVPKPIVRVLPKSKPVPEEVVSLEPVLTLPPDPGFNSLVDLYVPRRAPASVDPAPVAGAPATLFWPGFAAGVAAMLALAAVWTLKRRKAAPPAVRLPNGTYL